MSLGLKLTLFLTLSVCSLPTFSQTFIEGKHYSLIANGQPISNNDQINVTEYFSFSCPGCFVFEPTLQELSRVSPSINLRKVHMPYGGRNAKMSQLAFVLVQTIGKADDAQAIFNHIHRQNSSFKDESQVVSFFETLGYPRSEIEASLTSFNTDLQIRKMNQEAIKKQISTVPSLVINNKYKVNLSLTHSTEDLSKLIHYLHNKS